MNALSVDLLEEIVSYVDHHQTLLSLSRTCRSLLGASSRPAVWQRLGQLRWPHCWSSTSSSSLQEEVVYATKKYQERHTSDRELAKWIKEKASTVEFVRQDLAWVHSIPVKPDKAFDFLLDISQNRIASRSNYFLDKDDRIITAMETCIAAELFVSVHFETVLHRFFRESMNLAGNPIDAERMERAVILVSESLWTASTVMTRSNHSEGEIRTQLDIMAIELIREIKDKNPPLTDDEHRAMTAIQWLAANFFGNAENYYSVLNSSIGHVLAERRGIPLTLAVIYKCILFRIGVHTDVIGLPGHVVLRLDEETFIDVFDGGKVLSTDDCRRLVASFGVPWEDTYLRPLTVLDVINRMLMNVMNCQAQLPVSNRSCIQKTMILLEVLVNRPVDVIHLWPQPNLWISQESLSVARTLILDS